MLRTLSSVLVLVTLCLTYVYTSPAYIAHRNIFDFPDSRQGEFAKLLKNYEIAVPARVTENGDFVSHMVHHHLDYSSRKRRDVDSTYDGDRIHYNLNVDDMDLHLTVTPNDKLFGPGLVIERRNPRFGNISDSRIKTIQYNKCHFTGQIKNQPTSRVAIATCNGLHGSMRTNKGEYFIEPVKNHEPGKEGGHHLHLVYKRTAIPKDLIINHENSNHMGCGVEDGKISAEEERHEWEKLNRRKRDTESHHRQKRSISEERNVETLVVVDTKMMEYYKNEDIELYVLTVMNMVSNTYHDSTIGNAVNIMLVRVMFLEKEEKGLKITHHADHTLGSFCKWQQTVNPKDESHPNHHDIAVLLTRYNICSRMNEPCSTLGLSQVSGMCQPHRSCNINEDTGLALAYTVAHEIGHNFGMHHDGPHNGCEAKTGEFQHVMSPQLSAEASPLIWSNCSRDAITRFLEVKPEFNVKSREFTGTLIHRRINKVLIEQTPRSYLRFCYWCGGRVWMKWSELRHNNRRDWGYCLNDEPGKHDFEFPVLPPGVMYDSDHQCRLQYGPDAEFCSGIADELCLTLWCQVDNKCLTRLEAAAQGTLCGDNMWCFAGKCVTIGENPESINGEWGEWGGWTDCSRTCGAGVSFSERHCSNPPPTNGGKYCLGERKRYRICNTDKCDEGGRSFRERQCSEFNKKLYKGKYYEWEPVSRPVTPCQLHCKPSTKFFSVMLKDMVYDGTSCRLDRRDMCISGRCRHVGCDWVIDSAAKEDHCGICHGDGSTCKTVLNEFKDQKGLGYVEAMVIPEGARNIRVEEVAEANNYLAVRNEHGEYYLNGDWFIQWSGDYKAAGTTIHYKRTGNKESFNAPGPLKEAIHIMLLFQSKNPGVTFEYTVPNSNVTERRQREFYWKLMDWTHCTSSCGGGIQRSEVVCVEMEDGIVDDHYCNKSTKPDDKQRPCNDHLCPARWWVGPWQHCSVSCGSNGIHRRTVICVRSLGPDEQIALEDWECEGVNQPIDREPCRHKNACPSEIVWKKGPWSDTCHGDPCGRQRREVTCSDPKSRCDIDSMPSTERQCSDLNCGDWQAGNWSSCTRTCGGGIQLRNVTCVGGEACPYDTRPSSEQDCNLANCPNHTHKPTSESKWQHRSSHRKQKQKQRGSGGQSKGNRRRGDPYNTMYGEAPSTQEDYSYSNEKDSVSGEKYSTGSPNRKHSSLPTRHTAKTSAEKDRTSPTPSVSHLSNEKRTDALAQDKIEKVTPSNSTKPSATHKWIPLFWEECSKKCGEGLQTRKIMCVNIETLDADEDGYCHGHQKPMGLRPCTSLEPCVRWRTTDWSPCSSTCGESVRTRHVECPELDRCDSDEKPHVEEPCKVADCIGWIAGSWSQCSKTCDSGQQERDITCVNQKTQQWASSCDNSTKPSKIQACNTEPCPDHKEALEALQCKGDGMGQEICEALKGMGRCRQAYVKSKCCHTCHQPKHKPQSSKTAAPPS